MIRGSVGTGSTAAAALAAGTPKGGPVLDDTVDAGRVRRELGGCPVTCFSVFDEQVAGPYWREAAEALREATHAFFNDHAQGYWVVTRFEAVKDLHQRVDLFSSESFTAWEPNPPYRFVPTQIDPPEHIKYLELLNPKFSPGAGARAENRRGRSPDGWSPDSPSPGSAISSPSSPSASRPRSSAP
jgi:hypothetical protein